MEKRVGIYFASKHRQTEKIAHFLGECFANRGWDIHVTNLREHAGVPEICNFDAVLIGAPMYMHRYARAVRQFIKDNRGELMRTGSTGFFSTCLTATPGTRESYLESLGPVRKFLDEVAWTPQWIASFPGALNYRDYNPLVRLVMKRILQQEGVPTDTTKDYEFTRWDEVSRFAQDFAEGVTQSPYRGDSVALSTRTLNALMPDFEQRIVQQMTVQASPEEVRSAIQTMELADMPLAEFLVRIRNLGRKSEEHPVTFQEAAAAFGALPIAIAQPHELAGGLIGQFWTREFGIRMMRNLEEFRAFADPAYAKALTNFWFDDYRDGKTVVRTETRIHSLGPVARRRFRWYWLAVSLGIRLYMHSVLRGIPRCVLRRRGEHHALAA